tara:strand:- start:1231 stop:2328 length:1098 start_codon:yes stop_codon:yes gene_type:complete
MSLAITMTTINKPTIIEDLIKDLQSHPLDDHLHIIIMGDKKSPKENKLFCSDIDTFDLDVKIDYYDLADQESLFKSRYSNLYNHIPVNSFARRNYADLLSLENNYDYTIRIDDDNFPISNQPFISNHISAMNKHKVNVLSSSNNWFNVCETLINSNSQNFYPRGFPYEKRWEKNNIKVSKLNNPKIGVNAGLWFGDPDIDAITRLHRPVNVTSFNEKKYGSTFILDKNTNCPINTQNTCYRNEILKIGFVSPFAGRYDDIICGYVINALRKFHDYETAFGFPILFQKRNKHNLWNDLKNELNGNEFIFRLLNLLDEFNEPKTNLIDTYNHLCKSILPELNFAGDYLKKIFEGMIIWSEEIKQKNL